MTVNHKRVLRIMRESSLPVVTKKRWVRTTDSNHKYPVYPNIVKDFILTDINQVWVADITYIRILFGFVYLAVILRRLFFQKSAGILPIKEPGCAIHTSSIKYGYTEKIAATRSYSSF